MLSQIIKSSSKKYAFVATKPVIGARLFSSTVATKLSERDCDCTCNRKVMIVQKNPECSTDCSCDK